MPVASDARASKRSSPHLELHPRHPRKIVIGRHNGAANLSADVTPTKEALSRAKRLATGKQGAAVVARGRSAKRDKTETVSSARVKVKLATRAICAGSRCPGYAVLKYTVC